MFDQQINMLMDKTNLKMKMRCDLEITQNVFDKARVWTHPVIAHFR